MRQIFVVTFCPRPCVFINIYGSTFIFRIFFRWTDLTRRQSVSCLFTPAEILPRGALFRASAITTIVFINIFVLAPTVTRNRAGFGP
jgi:hypothetical protein